MQQVGGDDGVRRYSLIMTPDTVSSSAAMRVDVTTDKNTGRWGASGGSTVTSARKGEGGENNGGPYWLASPEEY